MSSIQRVLESDSFKDVIDKLNEVIIFSESMKQALSNFQKEIDEDVVIGSKVQCLAEIGYESENDGKRIVLTCNSGDVFAITGDVSSISCKYIREDNSDFVEESAYVEYLEDYNFSVQNYENTSCCELMITLKKVDGFNIKKYSDVQTAIAQAYKIVLGANQRVQDVANKLPEIEKRIPVIRVGTEVPDDSLGEDGDIYIQIIE